MLATYYIITALPLNPSHRAALADVHRAATGNELAVIPNIDQTACIVKVKTESLPEQIIPAGMVASDVLSDIDEARALLASPSWSPSAA